MKLWGRVALAMAIGAVCAMTLGVVLAAAAVSAAKSLQLGCEPTRFEGETHYICPDGIGYLIPSLAIMAIAGFVASLVALSWQMRGADPEERARISTCLVRATSVFVSAVSFGIFLWHVAEYDEFHVGHGPIVVTLVMAFAGVATLLATWVSTTASIVCGGMYAAVILGVGAYSFILFPFALIPAAFLFGAVVIGVPARQGEAR